MADDVNHRGRLHRITHDDRWIGADSGVFVMCMWRMPPPFRMWWGRSYFMPLLDGAGWHRIPTRRACWRGGWRTMHNATLLDQMASAPEPMQAMTALRAACEGETDGR